MDRGLDRFGLNLNGELQTGGEFSERLAEVNSLAIFSIFSGKLDSHLLESDRK
jgi:hypothetical protein